jgi:hypothetical protein
LSAGFFVHNKCISHQKKKNLTMVRVQASRRRSGRARKPTRAIVESSESEEEVQIKSQKIKPSAKKSGAIREVGRMHVVVVDDAER